MFFFWQLAWVNQQNDCFQAIPPPWNYNLLQSSHLLVGLIICKFGYISDLSDITTSTMKNWGKYRVTRTTCRWERHPSWLFSWTLWHLGNCNVGWVVPPPKNGAFKPSVARNSWLYLHHPSSFIGLLNSGMLIRSGWINFCILLFMGPLLPPKMNEPTL